MKICINCNENKLLTEFEFRKDTNTYRNRCKQCSKNYLSGYYDKNKEKINKRNSDDYYKNKEHYNKLTLQNYYENIDEIKKRKKEHYDRTHTKQKRTLPERQIASFLTENNIQFTCEKSFPDCKNDKGNSLFFDFYLPEQNILIEFQGEHHYRPMWGQDKFERDQLHDKLKTEYCSKNNIQLLIISYKDDLLEKLVPVSPGTPRRLL